MPISTCSFSGCEETVVHCETGRPKLYHADRCRYAARRQRQREHSALHRDDKFRAQVGPGASPVRITKPDGSVVVQPPYTLGEMIDGF